MEKIICTVVEVGPDGVEQPHGAIRVISVPRQGERLNLHGPGGFTHWRITGVQHWCSLGPEGVHTVALYVERLDVPDPAPA